MTTLFKKTKQVGGDCADKRLEFPVGSCSGTHWNYLGGRKPGLVFMADWYQRHKRMSRPGLFDFGRPLASYLEHPGQYPYA